jgi:hypothetical protein
MQTASGLDLDARVLKRLPHLGSVVHDEPEVARLVGSARLAVRKREELIAHVEEGHARQPAAQLELKNPAVELDRLLYVSHAERYMIDADHPSHVLSLRRVEKLKA